MNIEREIAGAKKHLEQLRLLQNLRQEIALIETQVIKEPDVNHIVKIVTEHFGKSISQLRQKGRTEDVTWPRFVLEYLIREHTSLSLNRIASFLAPAVNDHGTVSRGIRAARDRIQVDLQFRDQMMRLSALCKQAPETQLPETEKP